jgi:hypothetical protein
MMAEPGGPYQFKDDSSALDFANSVAEALKGGDGQISLPGVALIECEDFTLPDAIVLGGFVELQGTKIRYFDLFASALKDLHGLRVARMRPVETPGRDMMTPFSMSLEVTIDGREQGQPTTTPAS